MKKITFDFAPYVLDSWDIMITRYNDNNEIMSQTNFIAHKIDGELIFEDSWIHGSELLNDAERTYCKSILYNS